MWLIAKLKHRRFVRKWKKANRHNSTIPACQFDDTCVSVGNCTYGELNVFSNTDESKLKIGNFCSLGPDVTFILSSDHPVGHISTFPFKVMVMGEVAEAVSKGDIIIDDDVWIGYGTTILSGVHVGQGAVIAAGSVVSKDIPPYSIAGGVPAKVIKSRFEPEMVEELLKVDYSKLTEKEIAEHINELYEDLKDKKQLDWMPKR